MMKRNTPVAVFGAVLAVAFTGSVLADGNRYNFDRYYHSEISVSEAYLAMEHSKGWDNKANKGQPKPVLIDVRTLPEYAGGHPEDAYNVPFPHIYASGDRRQTASKLYWEVYDIVKGNLDTPIMLLCRTGNRSIGAGNVLADPDSNSLTVGLPAFTNVRNIWEGFVGQYKYASNTSGVPLNPPLALDLNNNGAMNVDAADVYTQVADYNPDKDGWRNFAGLPWTTKIRKPLAYEQDPGLYQILGLTPVE